MTSETMIDFVGIPKMNDILEVRTKTHLSEKSKWIAFEYAYDPGT
jgi:hypothetical protein